MTDTIRTFRMPTVVSEKGAIKEAISPAIWGIEKKDWMRHYKTLWVGIQLPKHSVAKRIVARLRGMELPGRVIIVDVAVRNCPDHVAEEILGRIDGAQYAVEFGEVDTPQMYIDAFAARDRRHPT